MRLILYCAGRQTLLEKAEQKKTMQGHVDHGDGALGKVLAVPAEFDCQNPCENARHGGLQLSPQHWGHKQEGLWGRLA